MTKKVVIKIKLSEVEYITNEQVMEESYIEVNNPSVQETFKFIHTCNFYKLFWLFILGSIFGCYLEQIQYYLLKGIWESRSGVIWGPFSEIYGLGTVIMYLISQKLKNASPFTLFCVASVCGSAFEYFARLFQEIYLGSVTWDYQGEFLNIGGRTSLKYGICWGLIGLLFVKLIFPLCNQILDNIKDRLAFVFTWFLIIFMSFNLISSALAVNRWNERIQGAQSNGVIDELLDTHYGDDKMDEIFPHLKFLDTSV